MELRSESKFCWRPDSFQTIQRGRDVRNNLECGLSEKPGLLGNRLPKTQTGLARLAKQGKMFSHVIRCPGPSGGLPPCGSAAAGAEFGPGRAHGTPACGGRLGRTCAEPQVTTRTSGGSADPFSGKGAESLAPRIHWGSVLMWSPSGQEAAGQSEGPYNQRLSGAL